jgi:hypothetical protein
MLAFRKVLPLCAALTLAAAIGLAQQATKPAPKGTKADGAAADSSAVKTRAKPQGRLPVHYGKVVDPSQKAKIYKIQQSYEPQIAALNAQLQALRDKRDAEIDAVLTAEQRDKVAAFRADAKKQRAAKAGTSDDGSDAAGGDAQDGDTDGDDAADGEAGDKPDAAPAKPAAAKTAPAKTK